MKTTNENTEIQETAGAKVLALSTGSARWMGSPNERYSEIGALVYFAEEAWAYQWPGWAWVAKRINDEFPNNRSARSCSEKYRKLLSQNVELWHGALATLTRSDWLDLLVKPVEYYWVFRVF